MRPRHSRDSRDPLFRQLNVMPAIAAMPVREGDYLPPRSDYLIIGDAVRVGRAFRMSLGH